MEILGLIGVIVFLAGTHLAWQARETMFYWLEFLIGTWRAALRQREAKNPPAETPARLSGLHHLRLVGGFGLMFLGQLLFILAIAL